MSVQTGAIITDSYDHPTQPAPPAARRVRQLLARTQAYSDRVMALNEIALAFGGAHSLDDLLHVVTARAGQLLKYEHCGLCLHVDGRWRMRTLAGTPLSSDRPGESDALRRVLATAQPELIVSGPALAVLPPGYRSMLIAPLIGDHEVIGALQFAGSRPNAYDSDDVRIVSLLAAHIASNIRSVRRHEALQAAQASLARYAADLEDRNRALDSYSHTIAHDLKAPLGQINGYAHLLTTRQDVMLDDEAYDYLGQIQLSVIGMTRMIDQLLFIAQLRGADALMGQVDMVQTAYVALERFKKAIDDRGIVVEVAPDLPSACGHEAWIEEVFANLIGNAVKYIGETNPAPKIAISAQPQGDFVRYEIRDNGIGIAPEDYQRLFQMFSRLDAAQGEGVGLGLSIVGDIIRRLGGEVGVDSDGGTCFWFTLQAACSG